MRTHHTKTTEWILFCISFYYNTQRFIGYILGYFVFQKFHT